MSLMTLKKPVLAPEKLSSCAKVVEAAKINRIMTETLAVSIKLVQRALSVKAR